MSEVDFNAGYASYRVPMMGSNDVATSQLLAAQAGIRMLQQGGNAVDAAIATAMALTLDDLNHHRADWVKLLFHPFAGGSVQELPPNGQGVATLIALGILEAWDIGRYLPDSPQWLHLSIKAMKLALVDIEALRHR